MQNFGINKIIKITTFKISKKLNIKYGRLREWIDRGYIKPSTPATGQGSKSEFTLFDVYMVELFSHLLSRGFSREISSKCINSNLRENVSHLRDLEDKEYWLSFSFITVNGEDCIHNMIFDYGIDKFYFAAMEKDIYIINFNRIMAKVNDAFGLV